MWDLQVQFAQRRKFTEVVQQPLYMAKCTVLANYYLGFNGWSTRIMQVKIFTSPQSKLIITTRQLAVFFFSIKVSFLNFVLNN